MVKHWHIATGMTGYAPDGSDEYDTATDWPGVADAIAEECRRASSSESDTASALAGSGDYESAWKTRERADHLAIVAENFSNERAKAPLYQGRPELWAETIERMAGESFPLVTGEYARLHVWECNADECEHLAELDAV